MVVLHTIIIILIAAGLVTLLHFSADKLLGGIATPIFLSILGTILWGFIFLGGVFLLTVLSILWWFA